MILHRNTDDGAGCEPGCDGGDKGDAGWQYKAAYESPDSGTGIDRGAVEAEQDTCLVRS
jgi:hypothetical protein